MVNFPCIGAFCSVDFGLGDALSLTKFSGCCLIKSFSLLSSISKLYAKNRYCMNHEAMSAISVFRVKFTLEFTSWQLSFLESHEF